MNIFGNLSSTAANLIEQIFIVDFSEESISPKFFVFHHPLLDDVNQLPLLLELLLVREEDDREVERGKSGEHVQSRRNIGSQTFPIKCEPFPEARRRFAHIRIGFEEFKHPLFLYLRIPILEGASEKLEGD